MLGGCKCPSISSSDGARIFEENEPTMTQYIVGTM
jgi:hypothetical protein